MAYTPVELIALILIIISAIKLVVIFVSPKSWNNNVVKKLWGKSNLMGIISLILAAVVFYYLLQELTIVQILATTMFVALLMAFGIAPYKAEIIKLADKMMKDKAILKKSFFYIIIWIALIVWGAKVLLF
jgi:hypothetical protein